MLQLIKYRLTLTMKILREVGITILVAVAIFFCLRATVQGYTVQYTCMLPSVEEGDWIMVNKASYYFSDPQRGDVIVFDPPISSDYPFIKRVIGLPGDTVEVKQGTIFINGIPLEEEYIMEPPRYSMTPKKIPDGQYFVLGDNRNHANDSHTGWTASRDSIIGKAWFIYWPPGQCELVKHYEYGLGVEGKGMAVCIPTGGIA